MLGASRAALIGVAKGDPFYSSTSLILQFEGSNGATTTTDESPIGHTITFNGDAQISTTQKADGVSSLYLDGAGDFLLLPTHVSLDLTGDFTIELKFYTAFAAPGITFGLNQSGGDRAAQTVFFDGSDLKFYSSSDGSNWDIADAVTMLSGVSIGAWNSCAVTRSGNTYSLYANGTRTATFTNSSTPVSGLTNRIGVDNALSAYFNGYIDQVRITKGVARYTGASYTVPTGLFPTS